MKKLVPEFIFETSWEVCNRVGGIYAVLSTRARSMVDLVGDNLLFVGPDIWGDNCSPDFQESDENIEFSNYIYKVYGLNVKMGRWAVPGNPRVALVDFTPFFAKKNEIYAAAWDACGVNSLGAYGDYDEASMFGWASGVVMHAYYEFYKLQEKRVVAHFNEWMTGFGLFYLYKEVPAIATLFTTHATTVGRSICGNGKSLYDYMDGYNGDQMAGELNVVSKHSVEKQAAYYANCFTTVSDITNVECGQLLEKPADVVTPNGFELDFVPKGAALTALRKKSRAKLIEVAETLLDYKLPKNALLCATSGRYEFRNKGIDLYINMLNRLRMANLDTPIVAFIMVPGWHAGAKDLANTTDRFTTHQLVEPHADNVMREISHYGFTNGENEGVKIIFVPSYLMGDDGIFNTPYYDLLAGLDFTVFPSYYEPWGYTPMESVGFQVPTITTDLSGFGRWANEEGQQLEMGVGVVKRNDHNYNEAAEEMVVQIKQFIARAATPAEMRLMRAEAKKYAQKAQWKHFFKHYLTAYSTALNAVNEINLK